MLGTVGEPTAGTVSGAVGNPAMYEWLYVRGGVGTIREPELHKLCGVGEPTAAGGPHKLGAEVGIEDGDGDNGGDVPSPSTWAKMAYSTGVARDAILCFFLALVIIGEMTKLLREGSP